MATIIDTAAPLSREVFWHIAAINHWREVFMEQLAVIEASGFTGKLRVGFVGGAWEDLFVKEELARTNIPHEVLHFGGNLGQFEYPTLRMLDARCRSADAPGSVLYFHSKAVSRCGTWHGMMWRWAMNCEVVLRASDVSVLDGVEAAGYGFLAAPTDRNQLFQGNFWLAKSSYVRSLQGIDSYHEAFGRGRRDAESWIGSGMGEVRDLGMCEQQAGMCSDGWWVSRSALTTYYASVMRNPSLLRPFDQSNTISLRQF